MFNFIGEIFTVIFFAPIVNLLVLITKLLQAAGVPGSLGFAIIMLTLIIRLALWPVTHSQIKATQKMTSLKPEMDELKKKHKDNKMALQTAQMELYKKHGVNPAAGCLPALIQLPVFIALYQSIINVIPGATGKGVADGLEKINALLYHPFLHLYSPPDLHFLGIPLTSRPADFFQHLSAGGALILLVPIITALLTFVQSKMMIPSQPLHVFPTDTKKEVKEKEEVEETMTQVQSQMVYLMPLMIGYFAFTFPVGLAIYWNTFTILGILQQYMIGGWGGLADMINRFKK